MHGLKTRATIWIGTAVALSASLAAQEPNPAQRQVERESGSIPLYEVNVVARTTQAVSYGHGAIPTKLGFKGTIFSPQANGEAKVEPEKGAVRIDAKFKNLDSPQRFGRQYLTYVLWAITPDGRASNLGEVIADGGDKGKVQTATELQSFALIMTAEPYYAVTQPSDVVVMENFVRPDTAGRIQTVEAKYELLKRGSYTYDVDAADNRKPSGDEKVSQREYESLVELYQARNAVQLAKASGAAQHAAEVLARAEQQLAAAERHYANEPKSKMVVTLAREATQTAEDARLIALRKNAG